jgi:hypothetical protein
VITVQAGRERRVQAIAADSDGRRVPGDVTFSWSRDNDAVAIVGVGMRPLVRAHPEARPGLPSTITVVAAQAAAHAEAAATVAHAERNLAG